jgi:hypothetical protein
MKRVKTIPAIYHVSDQRLNDLCLLAIERELSHDLLINPSSVIEKFALLADRKLPLHKTKSVIFSYNEISQIYQHYMVLTVFEAGLSFEHLLELSFVFMIPSVN